MKSAGKTITILDANEIAIPNNTKTVNVVFQDILETDKYAVQMQVINDKDAHPQIFGPILLIARNSYGFQAELPYHVDSPNYRLSYVVFDHGQPDLLTRMREEWKKAISDSPQVFRTPIFKDSCQHKWKRYHGLMDSFDYCETCDEKRK